MEKTVLNKSAWIKACTYRVESSIISIDSNIRDIIAAFNYFGKTPIVFSGRSGRISIIYFASVIGVPVGIASARSYSCIFLRTGIIKKLLEITRNKKKKHDRIIMLAKSKLNSIETLISSISRF